jgi:predicted DNA-binding transcriptional regulator YafY
VQRDIEQIRFEFDIYIRYNRLQNGYFIHQDSVGQTENFIRFFELVNTAGLLSESLKQSREMLRYISFEAHGTLKGIELLRPLLMAAVQQRLIEFEYEDFVNGTISHSRVLPYFLKEFQNRWYLIAGINNTEVIKPFGIDRITNLRLMDHTFESSDSREIMARYKDIIGVNIPDDPVEEVVLSFHSLQGKYIKALPLHHSQIIRQETEEELIISLQIIPNFEFKQRILMMGEGVKVLEPQWFVEEITKSLKRTLNNYNS